MSGRQKTFYLVTSLIAAFGAFAVVAADIIGIIVVEKHNPISETVSKLAIGKYAWIQDLGLDLFALGWLGLAAGLYRLGRGQGWKWKLSIFLMVLLAADFVLIAEHNQYATEATPKEAIHTQLVYALGGLFLLICCFMAPGLKNFGKGWRNFSLVCAGVWLVTTPFFFFISTQWDGLFERISGSTLVVWMLGMANLLYQQGAKIRQAGTAR